MKRVDAALAGAVLLLAVYLLTLAPDVTFWDAGEFIAATHSLGVPHPPGTPLFILLAHVWAQLLPIVAYPVATNFFSAAATATAAGITGRLVHRATRNGAMAFASAVAAGGMSSVWLNATETEVYAASLALAVVTLAVAERAGRADDERWTVLTAYLIVLAVPLHLSALVVAPVAIFLTSYAREGSERVRWRRALLLTGAFVAALGIGRMSLAITIAGVVALLGSVAPVPPREAPSRRILVAAGTLAVIGLAASVLAFLYVRARLDPPINQGNPSTWTALADVVARRQYDVSPIWPREAPVWLQIANLGQYFDWQIALSLGPTVMPSILRSVATVLFLLLAWEGALALWRLDRRMALAVMLLFACGAFGVLVYLNLRAGPSIGFGFLDPKLVREARERDYFFVFAFWAWGVWAGIGAVSWLTRKRRPAWTGALLACLPLALNWRAVSRRPDPERSLPRVFAEAILESAPENAVLFAGGDNDTYPLWYAQQVRALRPDVTVVVVPLLPTEWYRDELARRDSLLTAPEVEHFGGTLAVAADVARGARRRGRPVAASITLTPNERKQLGAAWVPSGFVFVEGLGSADTAVARQWVQWVERRVPPGAVRPAIDPVNSFFRSVLDCPRRLLDATQAPDSARLDSTCNYK